MSGNIPNKPPINVAPKVLGASYPNKRRAARVSVAQDRLHVRFSSDDGAIEVVGILTDVSTVGVGIFVQFDIPAGVMGSIEFCNNKTTMSFNARVAWCNRMPTQGVVIKTSADYHWRVGIELFMENEEQKEFLKSIMRR